MRVANMSPSVTLHSMGYGVVRPSIGPVMRRVQILTLVHFVFGVLYSVGIVLLLIEQGGAWVFFFIFPLAFTLTSFLMWTLHSLNATVAHLTARKQSESCLPQEIVGKEV